MEKVDGTGQVVGMREQVPEADRDLAERIAGTTLHYSGYEVGDDIIGWSENLEVTVTSGSIFVEALHEDASAAEQAATERANAAPADRPRSDALGGVEAMARDDVSAQPAGDARPDEAEREDE